MKVNRRFFSRILCLNSLLVFPSVSISQGIMKVHPSATKLAEQCMTLNIDERKLALDYLVNEATSEVYINTVVDEIQSKIDGIENRKVQTRKDRVRNSTVEGSIINAMLKVDNFKAKCFAIQRLFQNAANTPHSTFEIPLKLNGFEPASYLCCRSLHANKKVSGEDLINVVVSDCFHYDEEKVVLISTLLSHSLILKFKYDERIEEEAARSKIISAFTTIDSQRLNESKKRLVNEIVNICENVEYEMYTVDGVLIRNP